MNNFSGNCFVSSSSSSIRLCSCSKDRQRRPMTRSHRHRSTMAATTTASITFLLLFMSLSAVLVIASSSSIPIEMTPTDAAAASGAASASAVDGSNSGACPGVKWKGGKQTVECRHRALITLPSNVDPQTQVLDLTGSNLQTLPRDAFVRANLLNLQKIYLASCRIGYLDATALRGLTNLVELDLSDNLLTDVPGAALRDAPSLRELRLSSNPIQKVETRAFDSAPSLIKLDLSDCRIESLAPGAFDGIDQLSHLRLQGNRLQEMQPDVVSSLPARLHGLELAGNPWICDCRNRFLRQWLHQHNVPSPATALCASPARLTGRPLVDLQPDDFACAPHVIVLLQSATAPPHQPPSHSTSVTGPAAPLQTGQNDWANSAKSHYMHVEASAGENATLTCRMSGVPAPEIAWLWRGRPMNNGSLVPADDPDVALGHSTFDFDTSTASAPHASSPGIDDDPRTVVIVEEGKYEKTSRLILSPARLIDTGEYVCVASNAAGLARANLTLRVEMHAPVVGGLGGAQIAGLGAGLFILLVAVIAILLFMLVRTRKASESDNRHSSPCGNGVKRGDGGNGGGRPAGLILNSSGSSHGGIHPTLAAAAQQHIIKSPSLSALEYGHVTAFVDRSSDGMQQQQQHVLLVTSSSRQPQSPGQPDIVKHQQMSGDDDDETINGHRGLPQFQLTTNNYSIASDYGGDYATMAGRGGVGISSSSRGGGVDILGAATGDYQSAQTDSFYPSALWDQSTSYTQHQLPPHQYLAEGWEGNNINMLPHVQQQHVIIANPGYVAVDGDAGEADAVSVNSYNLPCRIPQQQQQQQQLNGDTTDYVPYPADFGLPRTASTAPSQQQLATSTVVPHRLTTTSMTSSSSGASSAESIIPQPTTIGGGGGGGGARMWSNNNNNRTTSCSSSSTSSSSSSCPATTASPVLLSSVASSKMRQHVSAAAAGRQHQQQQQQQLHHHLVARDSPDEGYQEECATDV